MKNLLLFAMFLFCCLFACNVDLSAQQQEWPRRLRRAESFIGIHFDFHAGADCKNIGVRTTAAMIDSIIDMVGPDYLQTDCKGHPGYSSYPTAVGNPAPVIVGDPLKIWREATARRGVGLYVHYSGVWDTRAVELHPDWSVVKRDSTRDRDKTSVFGSYGDSLLIPQLKELAGKYGIDGVWVDGECWATVPDYGERSLRLFREETGLSEAPRRRSDPGWFEWMQFHREAFRAYLRHYTAAVHSEYPEFQICSNWAFTHQQSEPVSVALDFLSGDYSPNNSVNSARFAGRYLAHQGMPWDLMAWSFSYNPLPVEPKTADQLKREAAIVMALGGGFQAYFTQNRDGSVNIEKLKPMAEVARFARERQVWCQHSVQIPQIALLQSTSNYRRNADGIFPLYKGGAQGILECLLESQHSVDIAGEATLAPDMSRFPLIIVPECNNMAPSFQTDLLEYVELGGSLLIAGKEASQQFAALSGIAVNGESTVIESFGKGKIGFLPTDIGYEYEKNQDAAISKRINDAVRTLFPNPIVEIEGSHDVDVSVSRLRNGKFVVHLVNTSGDHRNAGVIDEIKPVGPLRVSIRCDGKPDKITLRPSGHALNFSYDDGQAVVTVPQIDIYEIIIIE